MIEKEEDLSLEGSKLSVNEEHAYCCYKQRDGLR